MDKWVRNYNGDLKCKEYAVTCFVLCDYEEGYKKGEFEICVKSWHDDLYSRGVKVADCFSEYRYKMVFKNKHEANKMWLWIKRNEPTYEELKAKGFKKSTW